MLANRLLPCTLLLGLSTVRAEFCKNTSAALNFQQGGLIEDTQDLNSTSFIGRAANARPLKAVPKFYPDASLMHTDGGNSGSRNDPGPLGISPNISSSTNTINILLWGPDGGMTAGYVNLTSGTPSPYGLAAVDPKSFDILSSWYPPVKETLGFAYMEYVQETNNILVGSKSGNIYVVHRENCNGRPIFTTVRTVALTKELAAGEALLNTIFDTAGNIWFTTGGIYGTGDKPQNSTTYGYITPSGKVVKTHIKNEMVENGIAVSAMNVFMVTGPTGTADKPNATGYMYSLTSNANDGIDIRWRIPYDAGSGTKGDIVSSRGAGSTPNLLTDRYVSITDKSDSQVHLNVYHQDPQASSENQLVCQVALFAPGQSNNDNAIISNFDGKIYGLMVQNDFRAPPLYIAQPGSSPDINGKWNDMSTMAGGMTRVDIDSQGRCSVRWTSDLAVKAVSVLSTKTGLVYSYIQDTERAAKGEYIWYVAGIDWDTGETVYQVRTGTGGAFNDNWLQGTVGPDGTFYQGVTAGIVSVKDGE